MGMLDVELSSELIGEVFELAERHYGDASEESIRRVIETALEMRLSQPDTDGAEVEEPVAQWESRGQDVEGDDAVRDWLFERRPEQ